MRAQTFLALIVLSLTGCQPADNDSSAGAESEPIDVSMHQLVVTPERFEGKRVRVIGYLHLEFEGNGLYVHREDFERALYRNGIWFNGGDCGYAAKPPINDTYVLAEGLFTGKEQGHLGMWSGSLSEVTRCIVWPGRNFGRTSNNSFKPNLLRSSKSVA